MRFIKVLSSSVSYIEINTVKSNDGKYSFVKFSSSVFTPSKNSIIHFDTKEDADKRFNAAVQELTSNGYVETNLLIKSVTKQINSRLIDQEHLIKSGNFKDKIIPSIPKKESNYSLSKKPMQPVYAAPIYNLPFANVFATKEGINAIGKDGCHIKPLEDILNSSTKIQSFLLSNSDIALFVGYSLKRTEKIKSLFDQKANAYLIIYDTVSIGKKREDNFRIRESNFRSLEKMSNRVVAIKSSQYDLCKNEKELKSSVNVFSKNNAPSVLITALYHLSTSRSDMRTIHKIDSDGCIDIPCKESQEVNTTTVNQKLVQSWRKVNKWQ